MIHNTSVAVALLLFLVLCTRTGLAVDVPGPPNTPQFEAAQADAAFEAEDYEKAYRMYMDDLVPNGDKYAQFIIGLMNLHGLGVPADVPLGAAWLELAAERGDASIEAGRDNVKAQLSDDEVDQIILRRLIHMRERFLRKHCG